MNPVWISAIGLGVATLLGAAIGFAVKQLPHKWNDAIMGLCAGIMLCAATLGLLVPAAEMAGKAHWWQAALGLLLGAWLLNTLDKAMPHLHKLTGLDQEEHANNSHIDKVLLFVFAIAIHKLPEGIATGVGFAAEDISHAWGVAFGIALQNIPEGMVVITPLLLAGVKKRRTLALSIAIALLEVAGVWIGYALGAVSESFLPVMLALAGGAMLYVVSDEMIPESHAHGYQKQATWALLVGFMLMVFMDTLL
ncbi:MAG: ZIP family metal transporter [Bacteroidales bacterium]|nr:ZIP family metal transporter [Bacteroidales bacterium]